MRKFLLGVWQVISFPFRLVWWMLTLPVRGVRAVARFLNTEPDDRPLADTLSETLSKPSSLVPHVEALRGHLLRMLLAVAGAIIICAVWTEQIIDFMAQPIGGLQALQVLDPTESVGVFMRVALFCGFTLAIPYIVFELWRFVAPGLRPRGRKIGLAGIPFALLFFLGGLSFTYLLLLPSALPFLQNFMGVSSNWRLSTYINFVTSLMFWIGIAFEFPLVVYVLTAMGIIKPGSLAKQWRIALVVVAVLSAAITPTVDPVNMGLVMTPMILLYFISIGLSFLASIGRKKDSAPNAS